MRSPGMNLVAWQRSRTVSNEFTRLAPRVSQSHLFNPKHAKRIETGAFTWPPVRDARWANPPQADAQQRQPAQASAA